MNKEKIWLSSPHMGNSEQDFVKDAFDTNWIAPLGPHVNGFEEDLQNYNKVGHAAALSSGTGALHLIMDILKAKPGDHVLVQTFTFCGSANPITYRGATPVFIDSELDTWNMCPQALEEAIIDLQKQNKPIKAIIPVHLYGMPAKMNEILAIGEKYSIPVIEDAAESLGSTYFGKYTGALGLMGIYSFNGNKIITTSGGGALVSNEKKYADEARFLATQARDPEVHYEHTRIGYNYRLSNVLAGIGRGQMKVLPERINQRRAVFSKYREYFEKANQRGYQIVFQEEQDEMFSNRWLTAILVDPAANKGLTREKIRLALDAENIESRPLWKPMHLQPVFGGMPYYGQKNAENLFEIGLCLPSGSNLTDADFQRIVNVFDSLFT